MEIIEEVEKKGKDRMFLATCLGCNKIFTVNIYTLVYGKSKSCRMCGMARRQRPYESVYNRVGGVAKRDQKACSLTYEEFLDLIKIPECFYCGDPVEWSVCGLSTAHPNKYNLDRMDNAKGYHKDNLVVCCSSCNYSKGSRLTFEEMVAVGNIRRKNKR